MRKPKIVTFKLDNGIESQVSEGGEFTIFVPIVVETNDTHINYTHTLRIQVVKVQ